jgi:hypothetical protein
MVQLSLWNEAQERKPGGVSPGTSGTRLGDRCPSCLRRSETSVGQWDSWDNISLGIRENARVDGAVTILA